MKKIPKSLGIGLVILTFWASLAEATGTSSLVTVQVVVMAPPCVINNNQPIDVNFFEIRTTAVDGIAYQMPIPYVLSCTDRTSNDLKMMIQGAQTSFDNTAIQVNGRENMGIRIINAGVPQQIGEWFNFTYTGQASKPVLYAVPVKQSGSALTEGTFSAAGSMVVEYQ